MTTTLEAPVAPEPEHAQVSVPGLPVRRSTPVWLRLGGELLIVAVFCGVYELLRTDMVQDGGEAAAHALRIVHIESALGLFHEEAIQRFFLHAPDVVKGFNLYYGGTHFVIPVVALVWLALRHPDRYARARTALGVTTGVAFVVFWLVPVAPPRLLPTRFGIIDTLVTFQQSGHLEHSLVDSAGDIYAAMPSLHVGWALWCTLVLYPVVRHRWVRALLVAYPVVTTVVVVATGNHFLLDALTGACLITAVWLAGPVLGARFRALARHLGPHLHPGPALHPEPALHPDPALHPEPALQLGPGLRPEPALVLLPTGGEVGAPVSRLGVTDPEAAGRNGAAAPGAPDLDRERGHSTTAPSPDRSAPRAPCSRAVTAAGSSPRRPAPRESPGWRPSPCTHR